MFGQWIIHYLIHTSSHFFLNIGLLYVLILQNRLADENPLATWTAGAYLGQLRLYTDSLNVQRQDIEPYIVYRGVAVDVASTSSESCSSSGTIKMEQPVEESLTQNSLETVEVHFFQG